MCGQIRQRRIEQLPLTGRMLEILQCASEGMTTVMIARSKGISVKTVAAHKGNIMQRLGVHTMPHAVAIAFRMKLLT